MQSTSSSSSATGRSQRSNVDSFSSNNHQAAYPPHPASNPPKFATTAPRPPPAAASTTSTAYPSSTFPERQTIKQSQAPLSNPSSLSTLNTLSKRPSLTSLLRRGSSAGGTSGHSGHSGHSGLSTPAPAPHHQRNPFHTRRKSTSSLAVQKGPGDAHSLGHEPGLPASILTSTSTGPGLGQSQLLQGFGHGPGNGHGRRLRRSASLRKLPPDDDHDDHPRHTSRHVSGRPPLPADWASVTASATGISANPSTTLPVLATPLDATPPQSPSAPTQTHSQSQNPLDLNTNMYGGALIAPPPTGLGIMSSNLNPVHLGTPNEGSALHQHIHDMVNKRISTMDYLRKAHDGRVYWFNTLRFDRPDLARMSYFDARRLARRATNYMMLGLSLPAVVDLNSASAIELLRSLAALMTEFEQFQQLHSESNYNGSGPSASSLSRAARLPNMFRRATPGAKSRRTSSSAASGGNEIGMGMGMGAGVPALPTNTSFDGLSGLSGVNGGLPGSSGSGSVSGPSSAFPPSSSHGDRGLTSSGTGGSGNTSAISGPGDSFGGSPLTLVNSESQGSLTGAGLSSSFSSVQGSLPHSFPSSTQMSLMSSQAHQHQYQHQPTPLGAASTGAASTAFATYYDNNTDLLPGEEYAFLLTPSLPFDPDFYETFATLCDVLIDCYQRILSLLPSPRDCSPVIMEQFSKADSRVRKLLVQGVVKEFEEHSRSGVKMEVANVGKIVLGGLM